MKQNEFKGLDPLVDMLRERWLGSNEWQRVMGSARMGIRKRNRFSCVGTRQMRRLVFVLPVLMSVSLFARSAPALPILLTVRGVDEVVFGTVDGSGNVEIVTVADDDGDDVIRFVIDESEAAAAVDNQSSFARFTAIDPNISNHVQIPLFVHYSGQSFVSQLDLSDLNGQSPSFSLGQLVSVSDGRITEWDALVIQDGSALAGLAELLSRPRDMPLPNYTGSAMVSGFLEVRVVPEPSSFILALLGTVCFGWRLRWTARHRRHTPTISASWLSCV